MTFPNLLDLSLPFAEVSSDGKVYLGKADGSGGVLNFNTCSEQLLYEVGDPGAYVTPDVVSPVWRLTWLWVAIVEVEYSKVTGKWKTQTKICII